MGQHLVRLGSHEKPIDSAPAVRSHEDEIAAILLRGVDDCKVVARRGIHELGKVHNMLELADACV